MPTKCSGSWAAGREILVACVELGGSVTGEHGIGVEKIGELPLIFSPEDLLLMQQLRAVFDPATTMQSGQDLSDTRCLRRGESAAAPGTGVNATALGRALDDL